MTAQTYHAHVMHEVCTSELCAQTQFFTFLLKYGLKLQITESATAFVTGSRERIIIFGGSELNGEKVLLG